MQLILTSLVTCQVMFLIYSGYNLYELIKAYEGNLNNVKLYNKKVTISCALSLIFGSVYFLVRSLV